MADSKPIEFLGSALDDLRAFPLTARREAGYQLDQVQNGQEPDGWKPMNDALVNMATAAGLHIEMRVLDAA
jgi:phage-related protein